MEAKQSNNFMSILDQQSQKRFEHSKKHPVQQMLENVN